MLAVPTMNSRVLSSKYGTGTSIVVEPENTPRDSQTTPEDEVSRAEWGGKIEFILTLVGYAVGLGNIWRFPYLCFRNGGGAFLIPYLIMMVFVGIPLFFLELSLGQFASLGPLSVWTFNPLLKGLGYAMVCVSWMISLYYNVIIAHVLLYLFASFGAIGTELPWKSCDHWWNTANCLADNYGKNQSDVNMTDLNMALTSAGFNNITKMTPSEEYYNHFILEISGGIEDMKGMNWKLSLCLLLAWLIVLACLIRGIQSLGKVAYFTALFPYVMLTILLFRGVTLKGSGLGIKYYLTPDFSRLLDARVWCDAATQIFYSLSACSGGLIAMSSYNNFKNNCLRDSVMVPIINCSTSIYAGFVIFSVLGFMATEKNVPVKDVAQAGPGLAFIVYPEALARMPASQLWSIAFFFMMATLGFGSQFSMVECVLSAFTDEFRNIFKNNRATYIFRVSIILLSFLLGLPMVSRNGIYLLDLVDYSVSGFPLLVVGLIEVVAVTWFYGYQRYAADIEMMLGKKPNWFWQACWKVITPMVILVTLLLNMSFYKEPSYGDSYKYPNWARAISWLIIVWPFAFIVGLFLWRYCRDGGFVLLRELGRPKTSWGPLRSEDRKGTIYEVLDDVEPDFHNRRIILLQTPSTSQWSINANPTIVSGKDSGPEGFLQIATENLKTKAALLSTLTNNHGQPLLRSRSVAKSVPNLDERGSHNDNHLQIEPNSKSQSLAVIVKCPTSLTVAGKKKNDTFV